MLRQIGVTIQNYEREQLAERSVTHGELSLIHILLCIYNPGSRLGAIEALSEMRGHLEPDETELLALTDSTLAKLRAMTDADFDALELYPDFDQ